MSLKLQNHLFKTYKQSWRIQAVCMKSCNAPCAQRSMCSINSPLSQLLVIWLYSFLNKNLRKQISQKIAALKEKKSTNKCCYSNCLRWEILVLPCKFKSPLHLMYRLLRFGLQWTATRELPFFSGGKTIFLPALPFHTEL